jgi:hypothetical protein
VDDCIADCRHARASASVGIAAQFVSAIGPIATEIHVPWNVGDQGKSGLVVLNVSFVARDPKQTFRKSRFGLSRCKPREGYPQNPVAGVRSLVLHSLLQIAHQ